MNPRLEIFSQGEEIVTGQITDTNAVWLSQQAVALGFNITRHSAAGDKLDDLVQVLLEISSRADCCLCTGGLGPTSDDLTAEAVAKAFNLPLVFDEIAYAQIERFFLNRQRQMPDCNRKQALLPRGSIRLDNAVGTAPGFALQHGDCWFAFMPGVPSEMRHLFLECIQPLLKNRFVLNPKQLITLKTIGIGESDLQERINKITLPPEVQLGFRADIGEVQTKLLFPNAYPHKQIESLTLTISKALGNAVYAIDGLGQQPCDLISVIDQMMLSRSHTLAIAETTSYGLLAAKLVGVSWLLNANFATSIEQLSRQFKLETPSDDLDLSAKTLANALKNNTGADMALIQLATGDNNNTSTTVITHLFSKDQCITTVRTLAGNPERRQHQAAMLALDLLRLHLQGKEIPN